MEWGTFSITHFITLILSAIIIFSLFLLLKNRSEKIQRIVLFILSLSGIAAIIFNLVTWNSPIEYLPFHMCSINAILLPTAIVSKNKTIGNLLLVWCLGALIALIANFAQANFLLTEPTFWFYYLPHTFEFGIPILLFAFGIFKFEPKYIISNVIITFIIYICVHFINVGLNQYCIDNNLLDCAGDIIQVNYMYSIKPDANPLLEFFWSLIPYSFWYMIPTIVIIAIYEFVFFIFWFLKNKKQLKG